MRAACGRRRSATSTGPRPCCLTAMGCVPPACLALCRSGAVMPQQAHLRCSLSPSTQPAAAAPLCGRRCWLTLRLRGTGWLSTRHSSARVGCLPLLCLPGCLAIRCRHPAAACHPLPRLRSSTAPWFIAAHLPPAACCSLPPLAAPSCPTCRPGPRLEPGAVRRTAGDWWRQGAHGPLLQRMQRQAALGGREGCVAGAVVGVGGGA